MMRYKFIHIDIYKAELFLCEGDPEKVQKYITERTGIKDKLKFGEEEAVTYTCGGYAVCYFNKKCTIPLLAHELLHVVIYILSRAGISLSNDSDEAYTYLLEFLMKKALETEYTKYK